MKLLAYFSDVLIPLLIFFIVGYGFVSKVKVYETFLKGAKDGLKIVLDIVPTLIGLLVAVGMLRASGFFEMLGGLLSPVTALLGENVFLLGGYGAGAGYFQDCRTGFLCGNPHVYIDELYGNCVLHHERVFSGGKGE